MVCLLVFGAVLLYALSFGPALWLTQNRKVSTKTVQRLYYPLEMTSAVVPGASGLLRAYADLWAKDHPNDESRPFQRTAVRAH